MMFTILTGNLAQLLRIVLHLHISIKVTHTHIYIYKSLLQLKLLQTPTSRLTVV